MTFPFLRFGLELLLAASPLSLKKIVNKRCFNSNESYPEYNTTVIIPRLSKLILRGGFGVPGLTPFIISARRLFHRDQCKSFIHNSPKQAFSTSMQESFHNIKYQHFLPSFSTSHTIAYLEIKAGSSFRSEKYIAFSSAIATI